MYLNSIAMYYIIVSHIFTNCVHYLSYFSYSLSRLDNVPIDSSVAQKLFITYFETRMKRNSDPIGPDRYVNK